MVVAQIILVIIIEIILTVCVLPEFVLENV